MDDPEMRRNTLNRNRNDSIVLKSENKATKIMLSILLSDHYSVAALPYRPIKIKTSNPPVQARESKH
ncbi:MULTISPECIES: hypothetical protein [unclassified Chryseobacterium]|uniref:hypothetical protein n=1 Tax=unclassified Chryseobacterium TaxID=2593645 RepID=UPI0011583DC3|nr:hypothetical protein [Chryseobacterium sp. ON_d1]